MNEFEKHLKKVLDDLKKKVDNGQDVESTIDTEAKKLADMLIQEKLYSVTKNPDKNKEIINRVLTKLQEECNANDTLIIFRVTPDEKITGFIQGDDVSVAAGIGYIVHKSKLPKKIILNAIDFVWDDEKT